MWAVNFAQQKFTATALLAAFQPLHSNNFIHVVALCLCSPRVSRTHVVWALSCGTAPSSWLLTFVRSSLIVLVGCHALSATLPQLVVVQQTTGLTCSSLIVGGTCPVLRAQFLSETRMKGSAA